MTKTESVTEIAQTLKKLKDSLTQFNSELAEIRKQKQELAEIEAALEKKRQSFAHVLETLGGDNEAEPKDLNTDHLGITQIPFRQAILYALSQSANGMGPSEVANFLRNQGVELSGSTSMETRVSNELYRLAKSRKVHRIRRGLYRLSEETREDLFNDLYRESEEVS